MRLLPSSIGRSGILMFKSPGLGYFVTVALEKPHRFHASPTTHVQFHLRLSAIWTLENPEARTSHIRLVFCHSLRKPPPRRQ